MSTAKEEVRTLLEVLPDDSSMEDIQYHIYVREKVERGMKDVEEGHTLSQEEVERRMSKGLGSRMDRGGVARSRRQRRLHRERVPSLRRSVCS